jgi:hypothetical protein
MSSLATVRRERLRFLETLNAHVRRVMAAVFAILISQFIFDIKLKRAKGSSPAVGLLAAK